MSNATPEQIEAAARTLDPDAFELSPEEWEREHGGAPEWSGQSQRLRREAAKYHARYALVAAYGAASPKPKEKPSAEPTPEQIEAAYKAWLDVPPRHGLPNTRDAIRAALVAAYGAASPKPKEKPSAEPTPEQIDVVRDAIEAKWPEIVCYWHPNRDEEGLKQHDVEKLESWDIAEVALIAAAGVTPSARGARQVGAEHGDPYSCADLGHEDCGGTHDGHETDLGRLSRRVKALEDKHEPILAWTGGAVPEPSHEVCRWCGDGVCTFDKELGAMFAGFPDALAATVQVDEEKLAREIASRIGGLTHVGLRKWCESVAAHQAWLAIHDMPDTEWGGLMESVAAETAKAVAEWLRGGGR